jgi:hypothetical protein
VVLSPPFAFAIWLAVAALVALCAATRRGARAALACALVVLPLPYLVDGPAAARSMLALGTVWTFVRGIDLALDFPPTNWRARLIHMFAIVDTRLVARRDVRVAPRTVGALVLSIVVGAAAAAALVATLGLTGARRYPARWLAAAMLIAACFELVTSLFRIESAMLNLDAPVLQNAPHLARSVAEFWSSRWNLVVGRVLRDRVFVPLARRSSRRALFVTFAVSGVVHAYVVGAGAGAAAAALNAGFFLLQPILLAAERAMGVRAWPAWAGSAWTMGSLLALSPLFVEPVLLAMSFPPP